MFNALRLIAFVILPLIITCQDEKVPGNLTDLSVCKVSHLGLDYIGYVSQTESLVRCQSWTSANPIHKINPDYTDSKFSDFSKKLSKSYCRNPNKDPQGPWCYTMDEQLINETCAVPLCSFTQCRITGPGMEYGGIHSIGASDRKCLKWNKKRNKVLVNGKVIKIDKYPSYKFPENNLGLAAKRCRNPDGDPAGPWCFVEIEGSSEVEKDYCDIPFCKEPDCTFFSKRHVFYSHFTEFDSSGDTEIMFGIKIWNPDDYMTAAAKISLSLFAIPMPRDSFNSADYGIEVHISHTKTGLPIGNAEKPVLEPTPQILKPTDYTYFTISWGGGFVTLNKVGTAKPIFIAQYRMKDNLMAYKRDKFYYFSVMGENLLWTFPNCNEDGKCVIHLTTTHMYQRFWTLGVNNVGHDLRFFVRAFHTARILLVPSPVLDYPRIEIVLDSKDNYTRIVSTKYKDAPSTTLYEMKDLKLLDFWSWREFSLSLFANTLSFYKSRETGTFLLTESIAEEVRVMRWFSVSSPDSVAHWTFFCKPPEWKKPPPAWLPECSLDKKEKQYNGTQSVTSDGHVCVPWASHKILPIKGKLFATRTKTFEEWNYCRDPLKEGKGKKIEIIDQAY